jgi:hypothetical protein
MKGLGVLAFGAVLASCVSAGPTGLSLIPIADILRHREALLTYGAAAAGNPSKAQYGHANGALAGLFDRVELGCDNDFAGGNTYNVKLLLWEGGEKSIPGALSVGFCNANGNYREPYVVGRYDLKNMRLHAGYWRTEGTNRGIVGVDFPAFRDATGMIEHLTGPGGSTWVGLAVNIPKASGLSVAVSVKFPSNHQEKVEHAITVGYGFRF